MTTEKAPMQDDDDAEDGGIRVQTLVKVPAKVTAWGLSVLLAGAWERCRWRENGVAVDRWDVAREPPTAAMVGGRWGGGRFKLHWYRGDKPAGGGREVTLDDRSFPPARVAYPQGEAAPAPAPAPAAPPSALSGLGELLALFQQLQGVSAANAAADVERIRARAEADVAAERARADARIAEHRAYAEQMTRAQAAQASPIETRLAALEARLAAAQAAADEDDDDEDDDDEGEPSDSALERAVAKVLEMAGPPLAARFAQAQAAAPSRPNGAAREEPEA